MAPKILIIDDHERTGKHISIALKREVMETFCATTGFAGLAIFEQNNIDLIVLDINLPDISGLDLCKKIRTYSDVPIIFLSARDTDIDRILGLEIGGDDYMVKPFNLYELVIRIKKQLQRKRIPDDSDKRGLPFVVDSIKRIITYYGKILNLRFHEYEILILLLSHPGHVYSREHIKEVIWKDPLCCTDRAIDSHIKNIRLACKQIRSDIDPIITHRGIGYSINRSF